MPIYQPGDTVRLSTTFMVGTTLTDPTAVTLVYRSPAGTSTTLVYLTDVALVRDSVGAFHADIVAATEGVWSWKWTGTGTAAGIDEGTFTVEPTYLASGLLCSLDDVRGYLQKPTSDTAQDDIVMTMISRASRAIQSWCEREFTPIGSATRRFRVDGQFVNLAPYDLRTVTTMTLDPTGTATVLTANTGYALLPFNANGGTYQYVSLGASQSLTSTFSGEFDFALLDIAGTWGMATIPEDVKQAAILTVVLWMRREVQAFTTTFSLDENRLERPEALPSAVRAMLSPYRRIAL